MKWQRFALRGPTDSEHGDFFATAATAELGYLCNQRSRPVRMSATWAGLPFLRTLTATINARYRPEATPSFRFALQPCLETPRPPRRGRRDRCTSRVSAATGFSSRVRWSRVRKRTCDIEPTG